MAKLAMLILSTMNPPRKTMAMAKSVMPILFTRKPLRNTITLCPIPTTELLRVLMDWTSKTYAI